MRAYNADAIVRTWPLVLTARSAVPLLCFSQFGGQSGSVGHRSSFAHPVDQFLGRMFLVCNDHNLVVCEPLMKPTTWWTVHSVTSRLGNAAAMSAVAWLQLQQSTGGGNSSSVPLTVLPRYL